ncbi:MAG: hypothetical protein ACRDJI_01815 [Actinomycetota bacterium]
MTIRERVGDRAKVTAASGILLLKAALGLWGGFVLMTTSASDEKSFLGETITKRRTGLGLLILLLAAITVVVAVQLVRYKPWARPTAVALEVLGIILAATRLGSVLGAALVSIVLSVAVITLVLSAGESPSD